MTREEAILILGEFKEFCDSILWNSIYAERSRAIDMAIEALQAEPKEKKDDDSLLTDSAEIGKENECKLSREDARYFLQGISDMFSLSPETEMSLDMAIEALSEGNIARDIATILENEQDMRVILNLVRCKDCRYWEYAQDGGDCIRHTDDTLGYAINTNEDDFCSYGERWRND